MADILELDEADIRAVERSIRIDLKNAGMSYDTVTAAMIDAYLWTIANANATCRMDFADASDFRRAVSAIYVRHALPLMASSGLMDQPVPSFLSHSQKDRSIYNLVRQATQNAFDAGTVSPLEDDGLHHTVFLLAGPNSGKSRSAFAFDLAGALLVEPSVLMKVKPAPGRDSIRHFGKDRFREFYGDSNRLGREVSQRYFSIIEEDSNERGFYPTTLIELATAFFLPHAEHLHTSAEESREAQIYQHRSAMLDIAVAPIEKGRHPQTRRSVYIYVIDAPLEEVLERDIKRSKEERREVIGENTIKARRKGISEFVVDYLGGKYDQGFEVKIFLNSEKFQRIIYDDKEYERPHLLLWHHRKGMSNIPDYKALIELMKESVGEEEALNVLAAYIKGQGYIEITNPKVPATSTFGVVGERMSNHYGDNRSIQFWDGELEIYRSETLYAELMQDELFQRLVAKITTAISPAQGQAQPEQHPSSEAAARLQVIKAIEAGHINPGHLNSRTGKSEALPLSRRTPRELAPDEGAGFSPMDTQIIYDMINGAPLSNAVGTLRQPCGTGAEKGKRPLVPVVRIER